MTNRTESTPPDGPWSLHHLRHGLVTPELLSGTVLVSVVVLAILGWIAFASRRSAWYWRLGGACATATLGLLIILMRILIK